MQEIINQAQELLGFGKTGQAIDLLINNNLDKKDEILHLKGRLNDLNKKQSLGVLSESFATEQLNQIRYALTVQINELKNNTSDTSSKKRSFITPLISVMLISLIGISVYFYYSLKENQTIQSNKVESHQHLKADKTSQSSITEKKDPVKTNVIKVRNEDFPELKTGRDKILHGEKLVKQGINEVGLTLIVEGLQEKKTYRNGYEILKNVLIHLDNEELVKKHLPLFQSGLDAYEKEGKNNVYFTIEGYMEEVKTKFNL